MKIEIETSQLSLNTLRRLLEDFQLIYDVRNTKQDTSKLETLITLLKREVENF